MAQTSEHDMLQQQTIKIVFAKQDFRAEGRERERESQECDYRSKNSEGIVGAWHSISNNPRIDSTGAIW